MAALDVRAAEDEKRLAGRTGTGRFGHGLVQQPTGQRDCRGGKQYAAQVDGIRNTAGTHLAAVSPAVAPSPNSTQAAAKPQPVSRPPPSLPRSAKHFAVVVGVAEYKANAEGQLRDLVYADDDATAVRDSLLALGWSKGRVKLLLNEEVTQRNVTIALESWLTKAGPDDVIVLYWSGHGYCDPEDPEKVYFACHDTDLSIPATGYRMDRVRRLLEERSARNVILFADTCHAGRLITRGDKGLAVRPFVDKMKKEKAVPKGWIFMVSAESDRLAVEHSSWSNGAFTHCLLEGLGGSADGYESVDVKDGCVSMRELRAYMESEMPSQTQSVLGVAKRPVITTSSGNPDIWNLTLAED